MCTYNGERFIKQQLESIAEQTKLPDEIVVNDDNSADSTVKIIEKVKDEFNLPLILRVNEKRIGVENNFSLALSQTCGNVIFFCDQDDVWLPEKIRTMIEPFQVDETVSFVYSDGYIVGPDLQKSGNTLFLRKPEKKLEDGDLRDLEFLIRKGKSPGIKASASAFSSKIRDVIGQIPEHVAHDSWVAIWGYALGRVIAINEPLYLYRRHDQTSGKSSSNLLISGLQKSRKKRSKPNNIEVLFHRVYERMCEIEHDSIDKKQFTDRYWKIKTACAEMILSHNGTSNIGRKIAKIRKFIKSLFHKS